MADRIKFLLNESDMPTVWQNPVADLPKLAPILDAKTRKPASREALGKMMPQALVEQELSTAPEFEIPETVRQLYAQWRPTPLFRARRLEKLLDTPAKIYFKYEGSGPTGSFKPNSALAQGYYWKNEGKKVLLGETGGGPWGTAVAFAGSLFQMEARIFMVRVTWEQKPYRRLLMETYGGSVVASPSPLTVIGRKILAETPDHPGSLGIAKSEALEVAYADPTVGYCRGSGMNHVCAHQSVIGQEAMRQMEMAGDYPDIVVGCAGGGSNLAGLSFPFLRKQLAGGPKVRLIAVEPSACPTLTRGRIAYDHGDSAGMTPLFRMHTLGHKFVPPPVHAGGLRAHNIAQVVSVAVEHGLMEAIAAKQNACFEAGVMFARAEGIVPAPESMHALHGAIKEAIRCKEEGIAKTILFGLSGHGHFDLFAYQKYLAQNLTDDALDDARLQAGLDSIPEQIIAPSSVRPTTLAQVQL
jgi:tryptophan synthase beta chain